MAEQLKRDKLLEIFDERVVKGGENAKDVVKELSQQDDFSYPYAMEVYEKHVANDLEPRTDLQKAVIQAFDENPDAGYKEMAERAQEILDLERPPKESTVSDYTSRFRNDTRRHQEKYTHTEERFDYETRRSNNSNGSANILDPVEVNPTEVDGLVEQINEEEEKLDDDVISFELNKDEAYDLAKDLIKRGTREELAREIMRQYE